MNQISEQTCPVSKTWMFKQIMVSCLWAVALLLIVVLPLHGIAASGNGQLIWWISLILLFVLPVLGSCMLVLQVANFHYSFDEKFLVIEQGIIAKQKRYIPYSTFQDVLILRSLTDHLLGVATVCIENASGVGGALMPVMAQYGTFSGSRNFRGNAWLVSLMGAAGNAVGIPGLSLDDAQKVRQEALVRIGQTAHLDQSGL